MKCSTRVAMIALMVVSLSSCIKVDTGTTAPTMGAELMDLSRAKALGDLSDREFAELRKKVLASF